jgi:hypothetical protein
MSPFNIQPVDESVARWERLRCQTISVGQIIPRRNIIPFQNINAPLVDAGIEGISIEAAVIIP